MDEQLRRQYLRWREAEEEERDGEAEAAFGALFRSAIGDHVVSPGFAPRTMEAVAAAAARDARRARLIRRILPPAGFVVLATAAYFGAGLAGSVLSALVVGFLNLLVGLVVSITTTAPAGADVWTVMASLGRVAAALLTNPTVTATVFAIQGVALAALLALRHLLGSDGESFR